MPYQPPGVWEDLTSPPSHAEIYTVGTGKDLYRKSMYTFWRRAAPHPAMGIFDAPSRDVCTVERPTTNTPLQALMSLHSPTNIEAARKLAEKVLKQGLPDPVEETAFALHLTLARTATEKEREILSGVYRDRLALYLADPAAVDKLLAIGVSPVDPAVDRTKLAALADVCIVIFNLSETITRK
jgi:hypothetical protein